MAQKYSQVDLKEEIVKLKDHRNRQFQIFTDNFHILKAALRYFSVKQGTSITSSKVANNFPLTVCTAGSGLKMLAELGVVEKRSESSSPNRYMSRDVDMERLQRVEDILVEGREVSEFIS